MQSFCESYNLKSLIKQPTCYKNPDKPTCIDLILTNVPRIFQSTCVIQTGLSDFYLMTVTVMRKTFKKLSPRIINYRSYKDFPNETFRDCLVNNLSNEVFSNNDNGLEKFCKTTMDTLNLFAPLKKKYARGNQMPFMTKDLSKEMMTRSRLRNKYLKDKTEENRLLYTQQRNKCVYRYRKDIDIASYTDDATPFIVENNIENVIASLEQVSEDLFNWFKNNRLKNNADKCHVLVSTNKSIGANIGNYTIDNSECENTVRC